MVSDLLSNTVVTKSVEWFDEQSSFVRLLRTGFIGDLATLVFSPSENDYGDKGIYLSSPPHLCRKERSKVVIFLQSLNSQ